MYSTYQMMVQIADASSSQITEANDELVVLYQQFKDDYYVARFFVKNFAFLLQISSSFPLVPVEDKASLSTTCCERTLRLFNNAKCNSPLTYLGTIYKHDLISAVNKMEKNCRLSDHPNNVLPWISETDVEAGLNLFSTEAYLQNSGKGYNTGEREIAEIDFALSFSNMLNQIPFKEDELAVLIGVYNEKTTKEIAKSIEKSTGQVHHAKKRLREKLAIKTFAY